MFAKSVNEWIWMLQKKFFTFIFHVKKSCSHQRLWFSRKRCIIFFELNETQYHLLALLFFVPSDVSENRNRVTSVLSLEHATILLLNSHCWTQTQNKIKAWNFCPNQALVRKLSPRRTYIMTTGKTRMEKKKNFNEPLNISAKVVIQSEYDTLNEHQSQRPSSGASGSCVFWVSKCPLLMWKLIST